MQSYINVNLKNQQYAVSARRRQADKNEEDHLDKYERRRRVCKLYFQKLVAFAFSQIGVGGLLVGYTIMGALVFVEVESGEENRRVAQVDLIKKEVVRQLWNVTSNYNVIYPKMWKPEVDTIVEKFQQSLVREIQLGYDGSLDPIWTFPSALMYSLSVFTTIGYGNLTPKTDWGKALTIFYAVFGIPLLLLYMANVGDLLATSFRQFYTSLHRCKTQVEKMRKSAMMTRLSQDCSSHQAFMGVSCLATRQFLLGYGSSTSGNQSLAVRATTDDERRIRTGSRRLKVPEQEEEKGKGEENDEEETASADLRGKGVSKEEVDNRKRILSVDSLSNECPPNEVTIPVSTCMTVFTLYILFGSLVFSWWEGWDYLDGSYFCFVSLVTIGFGDLIPGTTFHLGKPRHAGVVDSQLIFCSIYILLGMALMAMCFHLTQERIFVTAKKVGKFFHLL